ncbi:hypothetical protein [uncultured Fibrobacter sp.]|mgnify:CR=1 FL=1|uniref:hypothetical protein n=1 Tax=uncultured Fibrobacter sp. TaxID=261512 RepID=UPI002636A1FC|nr:hypothetical protein [uncultured Fibrobacter sp.]
MAENTTSLIDRRQKLVDEQTLKNITLQDLLYMCSGTGSDRDQVHTVGELADFLFGGNIGSFTVKSTDGGMLQTVTITANAVTYSKTVSGETTTRTIAFNGNSDLENLRLKVLKGGIATGTTTHKLQVDDVLELLDNLVTENDVYVNGGGKIHVGSSFFTEVKNVELSSGDTFKDVGVLGNVNADGCFDITFGFKQVPNAHIGTPVVAIRDDRNRDITEADFSENDDDGWHYLRVCGRWTPSELDPSPDTPATLKVVLKMDSVVGSRSPKVSYSGFIVKQGIL